ncbi:MAG: DUF3052 domain-containing protein [Actinobacteria bacterium]|nr:DUF3052 domain-containing protein [Actinomycetota bacterium]
MAGYSGTPLARKLGIAEGATIAVLNAPPGYLRATVVHPVDVTVRTDIRGRVELIHLFTTSRAELARRIDALGRAIHPAGTLWVSWPKRSSGVETDLTEDVVREVALPRGLVDVKVAAIDDTWSGLKLVWRREHR